MIVPLFAAVAMEPSTYDFDSHHLVRDQSTGNFYPPLKHVVLSRRDSAASYRTGSLRGLGFGSLRGFGSDYRGSSHQVAPPNRRFTLNPIRKFLSSEGIELDDTSTVINVNDLPDRYDPSDVKASFTWFGALCLAGIGMFVEAYLIITTGQVKTVWYDQFPTCWKPEKDQHCPNKIECCGLFPNTPTLNNGTCVPQSPDVCTLEGEYPPSVLCPVGLLNSISYSEFAGIMLGMIVIGMLADVIGKVRAGIFTSVLMLSGVTVMSFFNTDRDATLFLVFSIMFGLFGIGVGGEYPLAAMGAASHHAQSEHDALEDDEAQQRHRALLKKAQSARRGETITLVFAMQGIGAVAGSAYILFLVYFSGQTRTVCDEDAEGLNSAGYNAAALNSVWRTFYLIGGTFVFLIVLYRTLVEEEDSARQTLEERKERRKILGRKELSKWVIMKFYGPRMVSR